MNEFYCGVVKKVVETDILDRPAAGLIGRNRQRNPWALQKNTDKKITFP